MILYLFQLIINLFNKENTKIDNGKESLFENDSNSDDYFLSDL